ncbi:asparaginase domain-containing protein [bacterium]|nr:asparaginase domain-containing protein [bacterium]
MSKILLIFYGGTGLYDKKSGFKFVKDHQQVYDWLQMIPELSLMAQVSTKVINKEKELLAKNNIIELISIIQEESDNYDGIIILHEVDSIPILANQLFWQIKNPQKPIVITGSNVIEKGGEQIADLSFKANIINAFQMVNTGLRDVGVIYGNKVIHPSRIFRKEFLGLNIFGSVDKTYLAKIDFGLSLETKNEKKDDPQYFYKFNDDFLFFEKVPNIKFLNKLLSTENSIKILVFKAWPNHITDKEKLLEILKLHNKSKKVIIFYNKLGFGRDYFQDTIVTVGKITSECLNAKLSWILGQTQSQVKIREMLKQNMRGEFLD